VNTAGIRWSNFVPGLICLLAGGVWALQGAGLIGGSMMTGQTLWIVVGTLVALVGIVLIYRGLSGRTKQA